VCSEPLRSTAFAILHRVRGARSPRRARQNGGAAGTSASTTSAGRGGSGMPSPTVMYVMSSFACFLQSGIPCTGERPPHAARRGGRSGMDRGARRCSARCSCISGAAHTSAGRGERAERRRPDGVGRLSGGEPATTERAPGRNAVGQHRGRLNAAWETAESWEGPSDYRAAGVRSSSWVAERATAPPPS